MKEQGAVFADVEVAGANLVGLLATMGPHEGLARRQLARAGVRKAVSDGWYPLERVLEFYRSFEREVGATALFTVGSTVPENAPWPPEVQDIEQALRTIDIAYHMNHRLRGTPMFDPSTGAMLEGIGHYRCDRVGKRRIVVRSDTPYPSEFDRGIIMGVGRRFEPTVDVELDASCPTRKSGGDSCTFLVVW